MSIRHEKLPIAALERIDDLCADFERSWQRNESPTIESMLPTDASAAERHALLAELLVLDIDYRRRQGDNPAEQDYLDRFPEDSDTIRSALNEGAQRTGAFEPPSIARLSKLFPALQIEELIGAGGMGAVYKARQEGLDRIVALKILPEEFGHDVKFALRFTREARTLARLNHPNIVSVYEFGHIEENYFFLMEYVDGSTLRDVVRTGQLQPDEALAIVPRLCDALQYAHDKDVVHRDIKPENILIAKDGQVKIVDFGLSRLLGSGSHQDFLTGTHQVMGTPRYMAPEQLEGAHNVDHRADIYSLGVVFYEMLTGELPIGRFAAPSEKVQIDVRLDDVVLRTLAKEPQRRYQHASQVKSDVESITSEKSPELAPTVLNVKGSLRPETSQVASLEQQELAGRLLLHRRELMGRVGRSLRPLFRGQLLQMLFGIAFIAIGVYCWAPNQHIPHRLVCGIILHVYGVLIIIMAGLVCGRIKRLDCSKSVDHIREDLDSIRKLYLRFGPFIGFAWWLLWIPLAVAVGFDAVLFALWISVVVGVVGIALSLIAYLKVLKSESEMAEKWQGRLAGESLRSARLALEEIAEANIH